MTHVVMPPKASGLRLCKITPKGLTLYEPIRFTEGASAIETTLRRAALAGAVGPVGETGDQWADLLDDNGDWFDTIALSKEAWRSLKNHWMRCKIEMRP